MTKMNLNRIGMYAGGLAVLIGSGVVSQSLPEMIKAEAMQDAARLNECYFTSLGGILTAYFGTGVSFCAYLQERYETHMESKIK